MSFEVPHDVQSASSYINNLLISKGYIQQDEKLQFCSQQLSPLSNEDEMMDSDNNPSPAHTVDQNMFETAVANDRQILNLINVLLETIDGDSAARAQMQSRAEQQQKALERSQEQLVRLKVKCEGLENQMSSHNRLNQTLESAKRTLESSNKTLREDLSKFKALQQQSKGQFANELRKRDVQISKLKQRLQEPVVRSKPLTGSSGSFSRIYNSYTSGQPPLSKAQVKSDATNSDTSDILPLLRALARENSMLFGLAYKTRLVLDNIAQYGFKDDPNLELSPEEMDNIQSLGYDVDSSGNHEELTLNSARTIRRTLNVTRLGAETAQSLERLSQLLHSAEFVPVAEVQRRDKDLAQLQSQLEQVTTNWQRAIKTMDEWKTFRNKN